VPDAGHSVTYPSSVNGTPCSCAAVNSLPIVCATPCNANGGHRTCHQICLPPPRLLGRFAASHQVILVVLTQSADSEVHRHPHQIR
jgi:hypothetical protein